MAAPKAQTSADTATPRAERARGRPREILDAARDLFASKGFEATRMDEVAAAVGVTKPAVYRYFPGKDQLISALLEQDLAIPSRALHLWINEHPGPVRELVEGFSHRLGAMQVSGMARGYLLLAMDEAGRRPDIADFIRNQVLAPGLVALTGAFERAMERGELAAGHDPHLMGRMFFAPFLQTTLGTAGYALPLETAEDRERYRAFHVAAFLRAFGA